jgi:Txe/YoeB family toxin of Txe-Axe toxin-antitoxin module
MVAEKRKPNSGMKKPEKMDKKMDKKFVRRWKKRHGFL